MTDNQEILSYIESQGISPETARDIYKYVAAHVEVNVRHDLFETLKQQNELIQTYAKRINHLTEMFEGWRNEAMKLQTRLRVEIIR